jgi:hypothetical protein
MAKCAEAARPAATVKIMAVIAGNTDVTVDNGSGGLIGANLNTAMYHCLYRHRCWLYPDQLCSYAGKVNRSGDTMPGPLTISEPGPSSDLILSASSGLGTSNNIYGQTSVLLDGLWQ